MNNETMNQSSTNLSNKGKKHFTLIDNYRDCIPSGNITYIIAFLLPVIIMIALYYVRSIFPFGNNCYLRSDMYHQYAPFFSELWNKLRTGQDLTYSWDIGMGTNFTSLFAYYLASPANWLIVLFPQKYMIEIMNALIILKMAGSCTTLTYYLSKHFNTKRCTLALFGIFYGLSGYLAAYSWNIMWLDCILLLPLIMLGLERLVNENKCYLYCISLGLCIFTNYYISIMVCLSVVFYFVVLMFSYNKVRHVRIYLKKIFNWCIYSLLAGGLAACLLLPELYTFSLSASSNIAFPRVWTSYFSVLQMLTRQLINVPVHLGLDHYPNIYCGVAVFILIPLYLINKKIRPVEKIGKVIILLIFLTAFNMNIPNFIWHGFHYPNSLPCRQSFIYIFFVITMSYEAFHYIKEESSKQLTAAVIAAGAFLLIVEQIFTTNGTYEFSIIYISGIFILIYGILLYLYLHKNWKYPVVLILAFITVVIEATLNMGETGIGTTSRTAYLLDYDAVETVTDTVRNTDKSFYRMDKITGVRSKNDGAWHNYPSISTFSSTANAGMSDFFGLLGFEHSMNAYGYNGATMVTNALFSVKYVISNKHLSEYALQSYVTGNNGEFIYRNNYTLPIGYFVKSEFNNSCDISSMYNGIENQNVMLKSATGISDVFTLNYEFKTDSDVTVKPVSSGNMYLLVRNANVENIGVNINGTVTNYSGLKNGNHTVDIGYINLTDSIEVYADSPMNLAVYTLDTSKFIQAFNVLNENAMNITSYSNTSIKGNVHASTDGNMLFSIPYDGGWSVYVDGKKVKTSSFKNALLTIPLTQGDHTIRLKYIPINLIKGCIITTICIMILIAIYILKRLFASGRLDRHKLWPFVQEYISEDDVILPRPEKIIMTQQEINQLEDLDDFDNMEIK